MKLIDKSVVKGEFSNRSVVELSPLDVMTGHFSVRGIYLFEGKPDVDKMKKSLAIALTLNPEFGASMFRKGGRFFLDLDNTGAGFSVYQSTVKWQGEAELIPVSEDSAFIEPRLSSRHIFDHGVPLNSFRLTLFKDGYWTLAIHNIHSQADGSAYCDFLQCWSSLYSGDSQKDRALISRKVVASLAEGPGYRPSHKFKLAPPVNFDLNEYVALDHKNRGSTEVKISKKEIDSLVDYCKSRSHLPISSSDVVHALSWKSFALSSCQGGSEYCNVYTIFNIRRVEGLAIPQEYQGNAILERSSELTIDELRGLEVYDIANIFRGHTKPLKIADIRKDIAYLKREHACGNIDEKYGRFSNFIRASVIDCLDGSGVYINDMRFMKARDITFDGEPLWFETIAELAFNFVGIYQNRDGSLKIKHVGNKHSLPLFVRSLREILVNRDAGCGYSLPGQAYSGNLPGKIAAF